MATSRLKLVAQDSEDLAVLSACLQDAVARVGAMTFVPEERRFAAVLDRFLWETAGAEAAQRPRHMVRCGLRIERVSAVKTRGIDRDDPTGVLELLAIVEDKVDGSAALRLLFAGGAEVRLEVERLLLGLEDIGEPVATPLAPHHELG
jgi:hypothetical protein